MARPIEIGHIEQEIATQPFAEFTLSMVEGLRVARNTCTPFWPGARRGETAWRKCRCDT
jgi:hypothetical protein